MLVEDQTENLAGWLEKIAQKDPQAAFRCLMDVMEYHIPKLARTEHVGEGGGPVQTTVTHVYETVEAPKPSSGA